MRKGLRLIENQREAQLVGPVQLQKDRCASCNVLEMRFSHVLLSLGPDSASNNLIERITAFTGSGCKCAIQFRSTFTSTSH